MREIKFKVYVEFEIDGVLYKEIAGPESWFMMTQTGELYSYGPLRKPEPIGKDYKVAIPLFYTGLKDENGKEAYHKDLISTGGYSNWIIEWHKDGWYMKTTNIDEKHYHAIPDDFIIIGNQFENPELLEVNNGK